MQHSTLQARDFCEAGLLQHCADHAIAWLQTFANWQVAVQLLLVAVTAAVSLGLLPFMYFGAHWYLTQSAGGNRAAKEPSNWEDGQAGQEKGKHTVPVVMMPTISHRQDRASAVRNLTALCCAVQMPRRCYQALAGWPGSAGSGRQGCCQRWTGVPRLHSVPTCTPLLPLVTPAFQLVCGRAASHLAAAGPRDEHLMDLHLKPWFCLQASSSPPFLGHCC